MQIQHTGSAPIVARDIVGDEYAKWQGGEIKSVAAGQQLQVRLRGLSPVGEPTSSLVSQDAADAIFSLGPPFVDVATGKNPRFVCAVCGESTTDEEFQAGDSGVAYRDDRGARLCVVDFLRAFPQYVENHRRRGFNIARLDEPAPAVAPAVVVTAPAADPAPATPVAPTDKPASKRGADSASE